MRILLPIIICFFSIVANAQTSFTICAGSPITLTATNPASLSNTIYSISPGTGTFTSNSFVVSPTLTTTYTLFTGGLTAGNTPSFTTSQVTVNVYPSSQFFYSVSGTPSLGCASSSVAIMVLGINNAATMSYTFNGPAGAPQPSYTTLSNSVTVYFTIAGTWTTTVLQPSTGCTTKLAFSILSNATPPPLNLNIPTTTINCTNSPIVLAVQASTLNLSTTWQSPTAVGFGSSVQIPGTSPSTNTYVTTFTLTVLDNDNLCETKTVIPIFQNQALPNVSIAPPQKVITCFQPSLTLINTSTGGSLPPFQNNLPVSITTVVGPTVTQNPGNTFVVTTAGIYTVTVLDQNNGCLNSASFSVSSNQQYPIFQTVQPVYNLCGNPTVTLSPALVQGTAAFQWTFPQGAASQIQPDGSIVAASPGAYSVTATNSLGCSSSAVFNVVYCVGIDELSTQTIMQVYPNPTTETLFVKSTNATFNYKLINVDGQVVLLGSTTNNIAEINTVDLPNGLYILQMLDSAGSIKVQKVVKQD